MSLPRTIRLRWVAFGVAAFAAVAAFLLIALNQGSGGGSRVTVKQGDALTRCEGLPEHSDAQRACAKQAFAVLQSQLLIEPPRNTNTPGTRPRVFLRLNKAALLATKPGQVPNEAVQLDPRLGMRMTPWLIVGSYPEGRRGSPSSGF